MSSTLGQGTAAGLWCWDCCWPIRATDAHEIPPFQTCIDLILTIFFHVASSWALCDFVSFSKMVFDHIVSVAVTGQSVFSAETLVTYLTLIWFITIVNSSNVTVHIASYAETFATDVALKWLNTIMHSTNVPIQIVFQAKLFVAHIALIWLDAFMNDPFVL